MSQYPAEADPIEGVQPSQLVGESTDENIWRPLWGPLKLDPIHIVFELLYEDEEY